MEQLLATDIARTNQLIKIPNSKQFERFRPTIERQYGRRSTRKASCAATFSIPARLERRCVQQRIRDRWVCCAFGSGARSCVKMKGDATWRDEKRRKRAGTLHSLSALSPKKTSRSFATGCRRENYHGIGRVGSASLLLSIRDALTFDVHSV